MRATLHRAAKTANPDRGRDLDNGRRHARHAAPRSGAHASRWCVDELPKRAPRPPRLRAERRARHNSFSSRTRVGPSELYGYDAHGNIRFLTDASGAETDSYDYDAWGNLVANMGSTPNSRLYVGEELDPDLGVINLRARAYKAETGRFLTIDPLDRVPGAGGSPGPVGIDSSDVSVNASASTCIANLPCEPSVVAILRNTVVSRQPAYLGATGRYVFAKTDPVDLEDPRGEVAAAEEADLSAARAAFIAVIQSAVMAAGNATKLRFQCYNDYLDDAGFCGSMFTEDSVYNLCMTWAWQNYLRCLNGAKRVPFTGGR